MTEQRPKVWSRRTVMGSGAAALAAAGLAHGPQALAQRSGTGSGGIGGGGIAKWAGGQATFSLFAARLTLPGGKLVFIGRIQWVDPAWQGSGLTLETATISSYLPLPNNARGREIKGTMKVNGSGAAPFVMHAFDNGPPGSGKDAVDLRVGAAALGTPEAGATGTPAAVSYSATATVSAGDIELVTIELPT